MIVVEPCLLQTPPFTALLLFCAVRDTYSSVHNLIGTFLVTASFYLCTMCDTYSCLHDLIGTSLKAALFVLCWEKRDQFHTVDGVAYIDDGGGNASYCYCVRIELTETEN
jgi:hypothetical protein